MGRNLPFDKTATCDGCGSVGAYDFMGDFFCEDCFDRMYDEKPNTLEINTYPLKDLMIEKKQNRKK